MEPPSYMRFVVDRNVVMRRIPVECIEFKNHILSGWIVKVAICTFYHLFISACKLMGEKGESTVKWAVDSSGKRRRRTASQVSHSWWVSSDNNLVFTSQTRSQWGGKCFNRNAVNSSTHGPVIRSYDDTQAQSHTGVTPWKQGCDVTCEIRLQE